MEKLDASLIEKPDLQHFVQCIQNKVAIATAIVIIKSKPITSSLDDHFRKIKMQCLEEWQKQPMENIFSKAIIKHQRCEITNEITSLMLTDDCVEKLNELSQFSELSLIQGSADSSDVENNSEFINAIVKLKFIVNSRQKLVLKGSNLKNKSLDGDNPFFDMTENSYEALPTGLFRHITHSSDTNTVMARCLESISKYLEKAIVINASETFNNWKGSVVEHVCNDLKNSAHDSDCAYFIIKFIKKVLHRIYGCKSGKTFEWEYQILILNEFCSTFYICKSILKEIFEKIDHINDIIKKRMNHPGSKNMLLKTPYILKLALRLLKKWNMAKIKYEKNKKLENTFLNKNNTNDEEKELVLNWKAKCEKLIVHSCHSFPLITSRVYDIVKIITRITEKNYVN